MIEDELGPLGEDRRYSSTEYRMTFKDNSETGSATEHGADLFWDQKTIDYGFLSLDASVRAIAGEGEQHGCSSTRTATTSSASYGRMRRSTPRPSR